MEKVIVCVTGSNGFIGQNLLAHLTYLSHVEVRIISKNTALEDYDFILSDIDIVYHLAGVNRTEDEHELIIGNADFLLNILNKIQTLSKPVKFILASSTQALLDNPYGKSKLLAESYAEEFARLGKVSVVIIRLPGVFGKWCKPNYNSVVATFCYNVINDIPLEIHNPNHNLTVVYIDDVIEKFLKFLQKTNDHDAGCTISTIPVQFTLKLSELAEMIKSFHDYRNNLEVPPVSNVLAKNLYSTYLSYLPMNDFSYPMQLRTDERGSLFEWIKQDGFGQVFVSTTKPGITRGDHFHHTKVEKFLVISGEAEIRFRRLDSLEVVTYRVSGSSPVVIDIPPGYTHSITNTGDSELVTLIWANEIFNVHKPDTYFLNVL